MTGLATHVIMVKPTEGNEMSYEIIANNVSEKLLYHMTGKRATKSTNEIYDWLDELQEVQRHSLSKEEDSRQWLTKLDNHLDDGTCTPSSQRLLRTVL